MRANPGSQQTHAARPPDKNHPGEHPQVDCCLWLVASKSQRPRRDGKIPHQEETSANQDSEFGDQEVTLVSFPSFPDLRWYGTVPACLPPPPQETWFRRKKGNYRVSEQNEIDKTGDFHQGNTNRILLYATMAVMQLSCGRCFVESQSVPHQARVPAAHPSHAPGLVGSLGSMVGPYNAVFENVLLNWIV